MGCTSSSVDENYHIQIPKPTIWLISGGPGSNKGKIIQYLIRDFKFKYLSCYDILQFQKNRNGPDAQLIKELVLEKKDFPSELIIKLIKKAIASLGSRRFLLDGFPRNISDIQQFNKKFTSQQINIQKFINIQVSDQKMKLSGLQVKKDIIKQKQLLQKQIQDIIIEYRKNSSQILQYYHQRDLLIMVDGNQYLQYCYRDIRFVLNQLKLKTFQPKDVKIIFAHFDHQSQQVQYSHQLVRKYGVYYYNCAKLINQAKIRNQTDAKFIAQCQLNNILFPSKFLISLIKRKIQKRDYNGTFLITQYPKTISDVQQCDLVLSQYASVEIYVSFQFSDSRSKNFFFSKARIMDPSKKQEHIKKLYEGHKKNKQIIYEYYQKHQKLVKIDAEKPKQIIQNLEITFNNLFLRPRKQIINQNIIFLSTIGHEGLIINQCIDKTYKVINMAYLYELEMKQANLYSDLIDSYVSTGKPVPGDVSVQLLLRHLKNSIQNNILIKGFPNSIQQLLSWQEIIGLNYSLPKIIYFQTDENAIKSIYQEKKINVNEQATNGIKKSADQFKQYLNHINWKKLNINSDTTNNQIKKFISDQK